MFSGIVQGCADVVGVERKGGLAGFTASFPESLVKRLKKGASISVDGVCLTSVKIDGNLVSFDVMKETLDRTTLSGIKIGGRVNVERSLKVGDEIGGHPVSGHVDSTAEIVKVETPENNHIVTFKCGRKWMKYIFPKGFIALDGTSLTVVGVSREDGEFTVHFIPETIRLTTFGFKKPGDKVNMEIDRQTQAIVDTIENILPLKGTV